MSDVAIHPTTVTGGAAPGADHGPSAEMRAAAAEFEAVFLAQVLSTMTQGLDGEGLLGGGGQGDVFRDMLSDEVAKLVSRSGGVGVADAILQEMLKTQEVA